MVPPRILVVDDHPRVRDVIVELVAAEGFEVHSAENGREAIDSLPAWRPDVILLDLSMPVLDGWGVLRQLQADPNLAGLPVIVLSANCVDGTREAAIRLGARDCILKSNVSGEQIASVLHAAVGHC